MSEQTPPAPVANGDLFPRLAASSYDPIMSVTLNIPPEIAEVLRQKSALPLERQALEAAAVEWYRQGTLLHSEFAKLLGLSRYEADGVLKHHGVLYEMSDVDFDRELRAASHQPHVGAMSNAAERSRPLTANR